ncbi:MAG: hypothetical protein MAG458_01717 [Nitrosopumilus sp.]|nr:hypothetical protein [Nitrosopumilus sp.]
MILISQIRHIDSMMKDLSCYVTSNIMRRGMCTSCYSSGVPVTINEETGMTCEKCRVK